MPQLPTGVRGLHEIFGGGLPELSFNIIAGTPGCGKTALAHQFGFANPTPGRPALDLTVPGEPGLKMQRYQRQYTFFDQAKLTKTIRLINLSEVVLQANLNIVLDGIAREVVDANPGLVVVDSLRTVLRKITTAEPAKWSCRTSSTDSRCSLPASRP